MNSQGWGRFCALIAVCSLLYTGLLFSGASCALAFSSLHGQLVQETSGTDLKPGQGPQDLSPDRSGPAGAGSPQAGPRPPDATPAPDEVPRLKKQIIELQNKGKLGFRKVVPCTAVEGFGVYSPLAPGSNVSKVLLYVEPENFTTLVTGDRYIVDLSVDVFIYDKAGKLISGKENALKINRVSYSPIVDLYYKIELNLGKPAGQEFVIKTALHDKLKNQSASTIHKIKIDRKSGKPAEGV
jgi:hypothetical protein